MAGNTNSSSSSLISIGNCRVEVQGRNFICESSGRDNLKISVSNDVKINISAERGDSCLGNLFFLINPKDVDSRRKSLLQEVLRMYMNELPTMKYAANTGKESLFLERCVLNGKYCTLLLKSNAIESPGEVIAAVTYQIVPVDAQYAEVPLAAIKSNYQHMGIGHHLYLELRKRLQNVGVCTILCWGDKESEGFWLKQGFVPIAEVDSKGKARRLPLKAAIRRALCFPGGSTLMVSHINKDILTSPLNKSKSLSPRKPHAHSPSLVSAQSKELRASGECHDMLNSSLSKDGAELNEKIPQSKSSLLQLLMKNGCLPDVKKFEDSMQGCKELASTTKMEHDTITVSGDPEKKDDANREHCSCSGVDVKKRAWQASCSSLKSKKVKGGYHIDCHLYSTWDLTSGHDRENESCSDYYSVGASSDKSRAKVISKDFSLTEKNKLVCASSNEDNPQEQILPKGDCQKIMLMDISDDVKKTFLKKIIEDLGGTITSDGSVSTHVITGKTRKTLNFCTALCSGAWIISTNWLKASFREGKFVDELPFILQDGDYQTKYKLELKDAVLRGKAHPQALFHGYDFCIAKHVEPAVDILSSIVKSAGGNVLHALNKVCQPLKTIFITSDKDMKVALLAAERGIRTYGSDWLMKCVMRQELDLNAPQFAEPL